MSKYIAKLSFKTTDSSVQSYKNGQKLGDNQRLVNGQKLIVLLKTGHFEAAEVLCWKGVDVNCVDRDGNSALHLAVKFKQANIVGALLISGANSYLKNKAGLTSLELAKKHLEIKNLILSDRKFPGNFDESNGSVEKEPSTSLFTKVNFGHFVPVLGVQNDNGYFPLEEDE